MQKHCDLTKKTYILFFSTVFLPTPMEAQNKFHTSYSQGSTS